MNTPCFRMWGINKELLIRLDKIMQVVSIKLLVE